MTEPASKSPSSSADEGLLDTTVIPSVALRWILLHATTSNVELARLSNVSQSWRQVSSQVILEQATLQAVPSTPLLLLPSMASQLLRVNQWCNSNDNNDETHLVNEKVPKETTTSPAIHKINSNETFCAAWFAPEGVQLLDLDAEQQVSDNEDPNNDDSSDEFDDDRHSKARMVPSNARLHRHCRHNTQAQNQHHHHHQHPTSNNHPNNQTKKNPLSKSSITAAQKSMIKMNIQRHAPRLEQVPQTHQWARGHGKQAKVVSFQEQGIWVTHQWQGYREAMEILHPFGYAECFVRRVLRQVQSILMEASLSQQDEAKYHQLEQAMMSSSTDDCDDDSTNQNMAQTTIAVRGATLARPEGYCLCWENPTKQQQQEQQAVEWKRTSSNDSTTPNSTSSGNDQMMVQSIKLQERQRKIQQWKEWRRQLQLTVLPQVLARQPHSCPVVQFLNANEQHAVRFLTPRFDCGPIGEPVTIIVVGIATEDGCFCSGLQHRFELGHLYPNTAAAELAELSPICMATDPWECPANTNGSNNKNEKKNSGNATATTANSGAPEQQPRKTPLEEQLSADGDDSEEESDDEYSEDSSSDLAGSGDNRHSSSQKTGWLNRCTCIFHDNSDPCGFGAESSGDGNGDRGDVENDRTKGSSDDLKEDSDTLRLDDMEDDEDDDDKEAERILRGSRIPGVWHCYSAVFDGKNYSTLRVDGVPELLTCEIHHQDNSKSSSSTTNQSVKAAETEIPKDSAASKSLSPPNSRSRQKAGPRAMLDGLTIGSDHCFDMTLCFGQGSGGEGEGAIGEIAVFSGRLDTTDLEVLEKQLMIKHGIPVPNVPRESLEQEDAWTRSAHALFCQVPSEVAAEHLRHGIDGASLSYERESIPLRIMAKHRSVAWHQWNTVTGEELRIKRIGSRSTGSSSDW